MGSVGAVRGSAHGMLHARDHQRGDLDHGEKVKSRYTLHTIHPGCSLVSTHLFLILLSKLNWWPAVSRSLTGIWFWGMAPHLHLFLST